MSLLSSKKGSSNGITLASMETGGVCGKPLNVKAENL